MPLTIRPYITPTGIIIIRYNIISLGNIALRSYFPQDQLFLSRNLIPLCILQRLVLFFFLNRSYYLETFSIYISNYSVSTLYYPINPQLLVRKVLVANNFYKLIKLYSSYRKAFNRRSLNKYIRRRLFLIGAPLSRRIFKSYNELIS